MSAHANPNIITDGLVFMYDTGSGKSYRGEPTINYIHSQNAVAKDSYTTNFATTDGTYSAKHPNAIRAYNATGTQLSNYYNSGVTDATNTYHAHWQYDPILKKPVVVMNDFVSGQWKAKWMGTGLGSWNSQGKSHGDTYTISWLQWVDHLSKNAKAGLYTKNTSGSNGFHDGQANSASSYNTKLRTWQRVYQTYTTNSVRDLSQTLASIYMYGHYNVRATVKVADVQFTWGDHPVQFSAEYERTATQGLLDLAGNSTIDLSNVSFDSNAQMTFDGTDDYILVNGNILNVDAFTIEAVVNITSTGNYNKPIFVAGNLSNSGIWFFKHRSGLGNSLVMHGYDGVNPRVDVISGSPVPDAKNTYVAVTFDGTTYQLHMNGEPTGSAVVDNKVGATTTNYIGRQSSIYLDGDIPTMKIYNKALTSAEVRQNFNATKDRFGL